MATVEELEAQLKNLRDDKAAIEPTDITDNDGIYLLIRDKSFECRRVSTTWQMMKFAQAQRDAQVEIPKGLPENSERYQLLNDKRSAAGLLMMSTMRETVMVLLKPYERERFEEYMEEVSLDGLEPSELENAIGDVIAVASGGLGKAVPPTPTRYSESSGKTNENVQAISFAKDTGRDAVLDVS